MGVPKFYRWISERYPCLSQVVKDYQIPEFDNFYLDMNGIIHVCAHPNDDDPSFRISEDKIFSDIFRYLEALFRIVKPRRVMFLAVDGVAPRAKMNQQRGRRFRSAREAHDLIRKAMQKGEVLPSEPRFDSNCITPGTEFMVRLHEHLKYFVNKKLSTDPAWQNVEVILSGQDVPGEGEHKIMDYIRYQKSQADYDSNTRHCLYGLDADLIMLGLLSHEPHFSLLREEVRFGKSQKRQTTPETITFHLLHLSILREYLDFEFVNLKDKISFGYDLEKIIDDWVLMGFLVGNDFMPHLPNMHIHQDALPFLYRKYMEVLPTLDGYINESGTMNMERFEVYLKAISQHDYNYFGDLMGDLQWLGSKSKRTNSNKRSRKEKAHQNSSMEVTPESDLVVESDVTEQESSDMVDDDSDLMFPAGLADFGSDIPKGDVGGASVEDESDEAVAKLKRDLGIRSLKAYFEEEDKEKDDKFEKELREHKSCYYQEKFGFRNVDKRVLVELAKCYVVGIQWVLHYYYSGVPSWSWYYPYHYAPFVSDIQGFADIDIQFELGSPFRPFQQLLAVLPPASKSLLPKPFQGLMINQESPVKDFYPVDFLTDLNGKQHEWEAVVLIPFIEEERLLEAMQPCLVHLSEDEARRNDYGVFLAYTYDRDAKSAVYPSPWIQCFPEITNCKAKCDKFPRDHYNLERDQLVSGLCRGVKLDVFFPGFPSLKHIQHTAHLEKTGVRVFQAASRGDNMILDVLADKGRPKDLLTVAKEVVGSVCYVGWPYLVEAKIQGVSDGKKRIQQLHGGRNGEFDIYELNRGQVKQWREEETIISRQYSGRSGIEVGPIEVIVYAQVLQGKRYIVDKKGSNKGFVHLQKEWAPLPDAYAYQTTVKDITAFAPEFREKVTDLEDLFPIKSECFILSPSHYGKLAEVLSVDMAQLRVQVRVEVKPEPDLESVIRNDKLALNYKPSFIVSKEVHLPPLLLSRITGCVLVERGSRDNQKEREKLKVGLNWKFARRNLEVVGYARKTNGGWSFSPEAIRILKEFISQFPIMFTYLTANQDTDKYYELDLFPDPDGHETLAAVKEWLKQLPSRGQDAVDCGGLNLDEPQIAAIEKAVNNMKKQHTKPKTERLRVKPSVLFKPTDLQGNLIPDPDADYFLFDRVVNVSTTNAVPFALKGTVTGIISGEGSENNILYEVVFDEEFLGGLTLRCSPNKAYRLPASCLLNITYGKRLKDKKDEPRVKQKEGYAQSGMSYAHAAGYHDSYRHHTHYQSGPHYQNTRSSHEQQQYFGLSVSDDSQYAINIPEGMVSSDAKRLIRSTDSGGGARRERQKVGQPVTLQKRDDKAYSQRTEKRGRDTTAKSGTRNSATSEFSSMKREMESHSPSSKKTTKPPHSASPRQATTQHQSQPSPTKQHLHKSQDDRSSMQPSSERKDEFSEAMSALSKLNISNPNQPSSSNEKKTKQKDKSHNRGGTGGRGEQLSEREGDGRDRELSPSVAAMFDAMSDEGKAQQHVGGVTGSRGRENLLTRDNQEPTQTLKSMLRMNTTTGTQSSSEMPDAIQKLMGPPTGGQNRPLLRAPLLPYPPPAPYILPNPYAPISGSAPPLLSRFPAPAPMPYGPPAMEYDPVSTLYQLAQAAGKPQPKFSIKKTAQGFVGIVEVGKAKYHGVPCHNPDDAKPSAAAIANLQLHSHSQMKAPLLHYPMYPLPYPAPYMMEPPTRFSRPPNPYYSTTPLLSGPYPPPTRGPRPSGGQAHSTMIPRQPGPAFVPLQVQRRQVVKPATVPKKIEDETVMQRAKQSEETLSSHKETYHLPPGHGEELQPNLTEETLTAKPRDEMNTESANRNASTQSSIDVVDDRNVVTQTETETGDKVAETDKGQSGAAVSEPQSSNPAGNDVSMQSNQDNLPAGGKDVKMDETKLFERLEGTLETQRETQEQLQRLNRLIKILDSDPSQLNEKEQQLLVQHVGGEENSLLVNDSIAAAALLSVSVPTDDGEYQEPMQPTDSTSTEVPSITVVGDILGMAAESGTGGEVPPSDGVVGTTGAEITVESGSKEPTASVTNVKDTPSKKSKRQIAASFMHS